MRRRRDQRGAATVLVLAMSGVLLLVGAGLGVVTAMVVAHRQAQSGADLAALAGAGAVARGLDGCLVATRVANADHVTLTDCRVVGHVVEVSVTAPGPHWLGQGADLAARARAGPAP